MSAPPTVYEGGCHCGAVRFRVSVDTYAALDCNCSIRRKKGFLHLTVPPDRFVLLSGAEALSTYAGVPLTYRTDDSLAQREQEAARLEELVLGHTLAPVAPGG